MELVSALEKAASPVQTQRQAGEQEIRQLEKNSGFHVTLLSIYCDSQVSMSSRYLAIIYLKNSVEQQWRRVASFSNEEKQLLRAELLPCLLSPTTTGSRQLAKQLAVIIASIARADFPRQWPELLSELNQKVVELATAADVEKLEVVLEAMHQTLKRLTSARIGQARTQFSDFSLSQIEIYFQIFSTYRSYTALKIVGTLLYEGHDRAHRYAGPRSVFASLFPALQENKQDLKIVRRIGKIYERLVERRPCVFCGFKQDAAHVVQFYCEFLGSRPSPANGGAGPIVQSMCIMRDLTRVYKSKDRPETSLPLTLRPRDDEDRQDLSNTFALCESVFTEPVVSRIVDALIQSFFQMTIEDVELWQDDPSEFVIEESRQSPEFSVVLCAELLFAHILKAWPALVAPRAQNLIEQAVQSGEELRVEGALRALEFGAATFSQSFEVEPIIKLLSSQGSPLIRRRLCLVVGGWIPYKENEKLQALAFELVKATISSNEWDIVVQLGALELVRICCDDMDFKPQLFALAADSVFETIYRLLQAPGQSTEVKLQTLRALGTIIEGLGPAINPTNASQILEILPALWVAETEHSNHHLVQGAVLQAVANLVTACGTTDSSEVLNQCYPVALPLVDIATDPSQPLSTYLTDDGFAVWKALLVNAPASATASLAPLFERLLTLLETKTEYLGLLLSILESYAWLDYQLLISSCTKLFGLFSLYLGDGCALDEALLILLCTEIVVMLADGSDARLYEGMRQTALLAWMENCIVRLAGDDTLPLDLLIQAGKCLNILALVSVQSRGQGILEPQRIYAEWLARIPAISDPRDQKLHCLGATALLLARPDLLADHAAKYGEVVGAVAEEVSDAAGLSNFYFGSADDRLTAEERRQREARTTEAAVRLGLRTYVKDVADHLNQAGRPELQLLATQMGIIQ